MNYRDVVKADKIEEYVKYHKKFFRELADVNTDVFYLEKIYSFPFQQFRLYCPAMFFTVICDNFFKILVIKVHRIIHDTESGLNILKFRNRIMGEYLKEEFKSDIQNQLKQYELSEDHYKDILSKVKNARHQFVAHKNIKYFNTDHDNILLQFHEIKDLVFRLNDFFKVLSFEVGDQYEPLDYYNVDVRKVVIDGFSNHIDEGLLPLIMYSGYVSTEYDWNFNFDKLDINSLNDDEKGLLEAFKKRASFLNI